MPTNQQVNALAAAMSAFMADGGNLQDFFASVIGQDRIVRKETALGFVRELEKPQDHIGLSLVPFLSVPTDDVIFEYMQGLVTGLAPARAEDAESELAQKDDVFPGQGRASVVDWALKDHYTASDISRYREASRIRELIQQSQQLPLTVDSMTEDWAAKVARDTALRRRKLDNRIEWLIMTGLDTGIIAFNDGKIIFSVNFQRPADQMRASTQTFGTTGGDATQFTLGPLWSSATSDPIADVQRLQEYMYDKYGVRITRALTSRKVLNNVLNSDKFAQRGAIAGVSQVPNQNTVVTGDPRYLIDGWGPAAAVAVLERATGVTFIEYDSVYRTRPIGSTTVTNTRFFPQNKILFLPETDLGETDDTQIGFGKVLTSPHPAGNWQSGFYEWEKEFGVDPWGLDMGTGIKAFPVFPFLEYSATVSVLAP